VYLGTATVNFEQYKNKKGTLLLKVISEKKETGEINAEVTWDVKVTKPAVSSPPPVENVNEEVNIHIY
jgi:hypothetical protein